MKIPLDFFLRLIEKFLDEREFSDVIKKLKKHFETPEEDFSDILSDLSLQQIISTYVKNDKDLKKKLKSKSKKFLEENKDNNEEEEKEEQKLTTKKRKRTMSSTKGEKEENEEDKKPKRKRTMSTNKEEKEKSNSKRKKTEDNNDDDEEEKETKKEKKEKKEKSKDKKRKKTEDNDEKDDDDDDDKEEKEIKSDKKKKKKKNDDDDIDLEKEVKFIPKPKSDSNPDRVPFKRIDDSHTKYQVPKAFRDNSYEAFMKQTGDDFGKAANDKLIVTRGKGFRKEKTKFKNKTFHGGMSISTSVRSIPLEDDSSSD